MSEGKSISFHLVCFLAVVVVRLLVLERFHVSYGDFCDFGFSLSEYDQGGVFEPVLAWMPSHVSGLCSFEGDGLKELEHWLMFLFLERIWYQWFLVSFE